MKQSKTKVASFLKKHGMYHEDVELAPICELFLDEMARGLAGTDSSLAMLPTYIDIERELPRNEPVIVMDAGGTNFRVATVCFRDQGEPEISDFSVFPMPAIAEELGREAFFDAMAGYVQPLTARADHVGFCFSYPVEMFPSKDGRVLYFSKEIKAEEVVGQMIGENLNEALDRSGVGGNKQIVLLNDTVATLLAGRGLAGDQCFDSYIGFILGTGTNTSYVERNSRITKAADLDPAAGQIVNVESGAFGKAPRGTVDKQIDAASARPGGNIFEKMISGAYLGPLCHATLQLAAAEGLFTEPVARRLAQMPETSTKDISLFMSDTKADGNPLSRALVDASEEQQASVRDLIEALIERAAKLTAINLSSAAIECGKGRDPDRPVCIVAEGTTFYKLCGLKAKVESYLNQYLTGQKGIHYRIVNVENATLIGAAIAGLTN